MTPTEVIELARERDRLLVRLAAIDVALGPKPDASPLATTDNNAKRLTAGARLEALRPWFSVLTARHRQIVDLRVAGKSSAEVAAVLGVDALAVAKMTSEARLKMDLAKAASEIPPKGDRRHRRWHLDRGNIKKQPDGRFRFNLRVHGAKVVTGPVVASYEEAEAGRAAAAAAIAAELERGSPAPNTGAAADSDHRASAAIMIPDAAPALPPDPIIEPEAPVIAAAAVPPLPKASATLPEPLPPPEAPQARKRACICRRCGKPGHFAKTCTELLTDGPAPAAAAPARVLEPPTDADTPFGGFSARAGIHENTDITSSEHATRTKRGILPPLIRHDLPAEHPVIVDVGGIDVVALEVGPATKTTTRVRWQRGPGTWGTELAEIAKATVLRDATDAEVQQDQSEEPEDLDVAETAEASAAG